MLAFWLGMWGGTATGMVAMWWAITSPRFDRVVIDPWWLDNEDRWADLREQLLEERSR